MRVAILRSQSYIGWVLGLIHHGEHPISKVFFENFGLWRLFHCNVSFRFKGAICLLFNKFRLKNSLATVS